MSDQEAFLGYGETAASFYRERLMARTGIAAFAPGRALDLGCGEGQEALWLADKGWQVEARDLAENAKWPAMAQRGGGRIRFATGDAERFADAQGFDLVFEKDMLHHAQDPLAALKTMAGLCRPGGHVVVVEGNRYNPIFYVHLTKMGGHEHFSRARFRRLVAAAGMEGFDYRVAEARVWPFNRAWAQRAVNAAQNAAEAVRVLNPWLCYNIAVWRRP